MTSDGMTGPEILFAYQKKRAIRLLSCSESGFAFIHASARPGDEKLALGNEACAFWEMGGWMRMAYTRGAMRSG